VTLRGWRVRILRGLCFPIRVQPPELQLESTVREEGMPAQPLPALRPAQLVNLHTHVDAVLCRAMLCHALCCVQDRPSIRYIRDVLRMRSSNYIELRFVRPTAALMTAMEAAGGPGSCQLLAMACLSSTPQHSSVTQLDKQKTVRRVHLLLCWYVLMTGRPPAPATTSPCGACRRRAAAHCQQHFRQRVREQQRCRRC
jgi:hypothetical protein